MPWTNAHYVNNTDDPNIGDITVVFTDVDGTELPLGPVRVDVRDGADNSTLIVKAKAAVAAWQIAKAAKTAIEAKALALLNA